MRQTIMVEFEKKASKDGLYAIAYALMNISNDLDRLGLNNYQPAGVPGTTEKIAMELSFIAASLSRFATNIES